GSSRFPGRVPDSERSAGRRSHAYLGGVSPTRGSAYRQVRPSRTGWPRLTITLYGPAAPHARRSPLHAHHTRPARRPRLPHTIGAPRRQHARRGGNELAYKPISSYGIIGDTHTAALVGLDGSIDWLCLPHFDAPSVFAALLDHRRGGHFSIAPARSDVTHRQLYWPDTNVLVTRFLSADGVGEITDYMPITRPDHRHGHHNLVRRVQAARGTVGFELACYPAFNY